MSLSSYTKNLSNYLTAFNYIYSSQLITSRFLTFFKFKSLNRIESLYNNFLKHSIHVTHQVLGKNLEYVGSFEDYV